jgi:hypothetical protein
MVPKPTGAGASVDRVLWPGHTLTALPGDHGVRGGMQELNWAPAALLAT